MSVAVAVDGWELAPPGRRRGMGRFLEGVLPPLVDGPGLEVVLLRPAPDAAVCDDPRAFATREVDLARRVPRRRTRAGAIEHAIRLPGDLRRIDHDVAWSPGDLPLLASRRPWVQTLHDLAPLLPGLPGDRILRWRWRWLGARVRDADRVVAVSRATADDGMRLLGLPAERLEVVPHGVDPAFRPDGPVDPTPGPRVVAVVSDDPRKGLADLARVTARLAPTRVEVAGALGAQARHRLVAAGAIVHGYVPDLPAFLRAADVLVHTAHHEGFGLVPLEAMACGTPVVAFDAGAVAEVVGDAAVLVPVGAVDDAVDQVRRLLESPAAREQHATAGLARSERFRWVDAAAAYARVLDELA